MQADLWTFEGARAVIGSARRDFEPPSTKDFVYGCWGRSFKLFGFTLCFNFIILLLRLDDDHRR